MLKLVPILAILILAGGNQHRRNDPVTVDEVKAYILGEAGCPENDEHAVSIWSAEHANLTRDGRDNLIVVAFTCNTGTAGPDVHSVYSRDEDGVLIELPIDDAKLPKRRTLFGNSNSDEYATNGRLVRAYRDTSDRERPLVIQYEWDGKRFRQVSIEAAAPFHTSYNCEAAAEETEQAICASEELAKLDLQLAKAYVDRLSRAAPAEKMRLRQEQREWIKHRNGECDIYKRWIECLSDIYSKRISQLESR